MLPQQFTPPTPAATADSELAPRLAVLIPCFNEAFSIGQVVREFRTALPKAVIYVYDNNSTDCTRARAAEAGAEVRGETLPGNHLTVAPPAIRGSHRATA